jgi:tRNA A-37 threonylcarbamoyl transferase component Bud32
MQNKENRSLAKTISIHPTGHEVKIFKIMEPIRETTFESGNKKLRQVEDNLTIIAFDPKYEEELFSQWSLPKSIDLSGKTFNTVEYIRTTADLAYNRKSMKIVYKSGTIDKVRKEAINYCVLSNLREISTLCVLGYVANKLEGRGFMFTRLEEGVVPLSAIDYTQIKTEQREEFIQKLAFTLGLLHAKGYTHNDAKLKNFLHPKQNSYPLFVIDLAKMNFSRQPLDIQAVRYDILQAVGDSVFHKLIRDQFDAEKFLKMYLRSWNENNGHDKPKPKEVQDFFDLMKSSLEMHPTDKNIQNLQKIIEKPETKNSTSSK